MGGGAAGSHGNTVGTVVCGDGAGRKGMKVAGERTRRFDQLPPVARRLGSLCFRLYACDNKKVKQGHEKILFRKHKYEETVLLD